MIIISKNSGYEQNIVLSFSCTQNVISFITQFKRFKKVFYQRTPSCNTVNINLSEIAPEIEHFLSGCFSETLLDVFEL